MKTKKTARIALCILLLAVMTFNIVSCSVKVKAYDLMEGITAGEVQVKAADNEFTDAAADFAFRLFASTLTENENSLISPLSVLVALAMTANGAAGETLSEMEALLGGGMSIETLNEYLKAYVDGLPSGEKYKLSLANSIWFRSDKDRLTVEKSFLQTNADYYNADAYKTAFDDKLIKDVNDWVKKNTDGLIDKILEFICDDDVMYLINALVFEAEWQTQFVKSDIIKNHNFTNIKGEIKKVDMLVSEESRYITLENATGFSKNYYGGKYSFVALLPDEGVGLYDFIGTLDGQKFTSAIRNASSTPLKAYLPAFEYDYKIEMRDALKSLGMPTAFSSVKADLSNLGRSTRGNLFIGKVVHKTHIKLDATGTKAGAATRVDILDGSAPLPPEIEVKLDRPFVYVIVDNASNLPIFIGTVMDF